jgi:thiol-disulfide isomerase/thioredoxin
MRRLLLSFIALFSVIATFSQAGPATADQILDEAGKVAAKENKNVFVLFHASWCGWCRKMDMSMNDPSVSKFFTDNYVIRHLVVYESKGKENLENPGALDLLKKYKGDDLGIPYWLVFDKDGKLLADSKMRSGQDGLEKGENVGCPANPEEVAHLIEVLTRTSKLKEADLKVISARFLKNQN